MRRFNLPILQRLQITHFSLYKKADFLDIDLTKEVYCLAGANGLGKSTFITIINFILTGIVKNPQRDFTWYNSIPAFYSKSKGFAEQYFDGRIKEDFHNIAEATIHFTIGESEYSITRGFFEPDELREFVRITNGEQLEIPGEISPTELNDLYKKHFTSDVSLSDFDQFAFLQSFVLTFDETHQLISWNISLMERILYLFFGVDADKAKQADQLRKEYNKYDSDVRNLQYQITRTRNELNGVVKLLENSVPEDTRSIEVYEQHKNLVEQSDTINENLKRISENIKDVDLDISNLSLRALSLRNNYSAIFSKTLTEDVPIEKNAKIISLLNDLKLRILTAGSYEDLIGKLISEIKSHISETQKDDNQQYFDQLQNIDAELNNTNDEIKSFSLKKERLIQDENSLTEQLGKVSDQINKIENENETLIRSMHKVESSPNNNTVIIKSYNDQIERLNAQKDEAYRRRNRAKKDLEPLETELNLGYINAEKDFIPKFNQYAKSFLGLDIHIDLLFSTKGANLVIDINDTRRKDSFQLSESQRYFIDIALRMALIDLCANSATILIDTPEGSLDIAYESRAGKMFADFAQDLHKIIMTANINSSQLLLELAEVCGGSKMKIERMTNWTDLSDVQQLENDKIESAYIKIEDKLSVLA